MSSLSEDLNKDRGALKKSIEILIASIEVEQKRRGVQKNINDVNTKFLENLRAIKESLNDGAKPIDPKLIRERIERLTGSYLVSLRDSKPAGQSETMYKKDLEAVQVGIGKALLKIEKVKSTMPKPEPKNWFVRNFRNLQNKMGDFIRGRQTMQIQFAIDKAKIDKYKVEKTQKIEKYTKYLEGLSDGDRKRALENPVLERDLEIRTMYVQIFNYSNDSHKKAVTLLPDVYKQSPEKMAEFLAKTPELDEGNVVDCLTPRPPDKKKNQLMPEDPASKILDEYIKQKGFNFGGKPVGEAAREFLEKFLLPKEGQKIDRVVDAFARKYMKDNPKTFSYPDAPYFVVNAVLILNKQTHDTNPKIRKEMSFSEFEGLIRELEKNKQIPEKDAMPSHALKVVYDSVKDQEITLKVGDGAASVRQNKKFR